MRRWLVKRTLAFAGISFRAWLSRRLGIEGPTAWFREGYFGHAYEREGDSSETGETPRAADSGLQPKTDEDGWSVLGYRVNGLQLQRLVAGCNIKVGGISMSPRPPKSAA